MTPESLYVRWVLINSERKKMEIKMNAQSTPEFYPLSAALAAAGVKPGKFHRHFYGGVLGNAVENDGEFSAQITDPQRGAGAGRGGGRFITMDGAICLAVFFRLMSGGVPSERALKMARTFVFLGEAGNGLRAFNARSARPAGEVFSGNQDTFLVAITGNQDTNDSEGFAFVSGHDLAATSIMDWLHLNCEDSAPVCLVNLSEVIQEMREGLKGKSARGVAAATQCASQSIAATSDPISAFLTEFTVADATARTSTREFHRAFEAWALDWRGAGWPHGADGNDFTSQTLIEGLAAHGVHKVKSNGNMMFAGIRWRDTPAALAFLAGAFAVD